MSENKFYSVMLFFSEKEMKLGLRNDVFHHVKTVYFENNLIDAVDFYANKQCPASQLIEGETVGELRINEHKMIDNFKNPEWVKQLMEVL